MDLALIDQAQRALTACGARPLVEGDAVVPIPHYFLLPMKLSVRQTALYQQEITGDAPFELRAISCDAGLGDSYSTMRPYNSQRIQIHLPNGRTLIGGNGIDSGQFGGIGSSRFVVDPPTVMQPGEQIEVSLTDLGSFSPINLLLSFEGVYNYALRGAGFGRGSSALSIPRYQGTLNQNILAPSWMAGYGMPTPAEFQDDYFVYSTPATITAGTGVPTGTPLALPNAEATITIPIEATTDFFLERMLVDLTADETALNAAVLGRVRTATGYTITDSFLDLAKYLNGVEFPKPLRIRAADSVSFDVAVVDAVGAGNVYFMAHLEGWKRRKL